jgi:hypothetical protein
MKKKLFLGISWIGKATSLVAGIASLPIMGLLPPQYALFATMGFQGFSLLKDTANRIGDLADDGIANNSFKG